MLTCLVSESICTAQKAYQVDEVQVELKLSVLFSGFLSSCSSIDYLQKYFELESEDFML